MDEGQKELLRRLQEMLLGTERKLVAKFDQIETAITTCLTTGETSSSSTTSVRIDVHNDTPSPDTTCCVAVESAPACSNNEQATTSPTTRALTAMPLLEATSEIAAGPDTLLITPSSASIVDENLGVDPSGSATSITKAPSSCSTDCSSQQPTADLVLVQASTSTSTKHSLDTNSIAIAERVTSKVHRPLPWPCFRHVHADGDETRPLPWPSFKEINGCESPSHAILKES